MDHNNIYKYYEEGNVFNATEIANRLYLLGDELLNVQCDLMLDELMKRVRVNFELANKLLFKYEYEFYDATAILKEEIPSSKKDFICKEIENLFSDFGKIPASVISFLKHNSTGISLLGEFDGITSGLCPFQIYSLEDTLKYIKFALPDYPELYLKDEKEENWFIPLIQNDLDKENVSSSGELVGVKIYSKKKFDGVIVNHHYGGNFVNYLREYLRWGGFIGLRENELLLNKSSKLQSYVKEFNELMIEF